MSLNLDSISTEFNLKVLSNSENKVLPYGVSVHGEKDFDSSGLANPQVARRLRMLARDLLVYGALVRGQFQHDLANGVTETFAARYR